MRHCAQMILVCMGDDQTKQIVPPLFQIGRIRRDDIDTGMFPIGEGDTKINQQPFPTYAVEVHVHADFAGPAQG